MRYRMHPSSIATKEQKFADTLNAAGTKYTECGTTDIGNGYSFRSIRPTALTYFYQTETPKSKICLHFTVGYIMSDVNSLANPASHVSVSYVVDRAGRIYELFPDKYWSYHLGSGTIGGNATMSKQTIGIEISNYGPLELKSGKLVDCYGNTYCTESETEFYDAHEYRGKKYYATMSEEQTLATAALLKYLCPKHGIPFEFAKDDSPFGSDKDATGFSGIFFHSNVRKDKYDWPLGTSMTHLIEACKEPEPEPEPEPKPEPEPEPVKEEPAPVPEPTPAEKPAEPKSSGSFLEMLKQLLLRLFRRG